MKQDQEKTLRDWYKLDTSAKIYPALESPRNTTLFRVSMTLKEPVDTDRLKQALDIVKKRFPYYNVHLKAGIFWNYLEKNDNESIIWPESPTPCERIYSIYNNGYLYMVRVYGKRIAMEFSHVLTDGFGGLEFLKLLVSQYLVLSGKMKENAPGYFSLDEKPAAEEYEDAFLKVLEMEKNNEKNNDKRALFNDTKVFKIPDRVLPVGKYHVITGIMPVEQLKSICKEYGVSITVLLAGIYAESLIHLQKDRVKNKKKHRLVSMQIPVNMRQLYNIKCMRNFSLFLVPLVDPHKISCFKDILAVIKDHMSSHVNKEYLQTMVKDNCALAESKIISRVPLGLKKMVIRYLANTQGSSQFSGTISNLGVVKLPEEFSEHIESMNCILGPPSDTKTATTVLGFKDKVHVTFGRITKDAQVEKLFFQRLVELGADVELSSN